MVVFGATDTMKALEKNAVERVLLYEEIDPKVFGGVGGIDLKSQESEAVVEWFNANQGKFGCKIEVVSDKT